MSNQINAALGLDGVKLLNAQTQVFQRFQITTGGIIKLLLEGSGLGDMTRDIMDQQGRTPVDFSARTLNDYDHYQKLKNFRSSNAGSDTPVLMKHLTRPAENRCQFKVNLPGHMDFRQFSPDQDYIGFQNDGSTRTSFGGGFGKDFTGETDNFSFPSTNFYFQYGVGYTSGQGPNNEMYEYSDLRKLVRFFNDGVFG